MKGSVPVAIKIITAQALVKDYDIGHLSLDLSRKTGVLIRQSRKGADKDHYESRLRQEALIPVAIALRGDSDDAHIVVYDEGAGVSGTKGYDQRPKLSKLYLDIANGIIGSLVVARADRLFRDKHFRNVSMFTEIAEAKKILLIVPGRTVYDFTKTKDLQAFQKEMQDAYTYISTQVAYMIETRAQKVQRGMYGGGRLPAPYVIDKQAWKEEQKPVIYHPWLEPALALFKRFHEYDFSLARIAAYIDSVPYLFPQPSLDDTRKYLFSTGMRIVGGGYTISSPDSLRKYLSNLTLGGFAKIGRDEEGNELLLPHAFEPAIPMEWLEPAYASITGFYLDGSPFEKSRSVSRQTRRKYTLYVHAALHGFLTSKDGGVSLYTNKQEENPYYMCNAGLNKDGWELKNRIGLMKQRKVWAVSCQNLDRIVLDRLCDLIRHDSDMVERIKAFWESRKTEEVNEADVLKHQIKKAEDQIARLDKLLTDPAHPLSKTSEERFLKMLAEVEEEVARLKRKLAAQQTTEDPQSVIPNFYFVLAQLPTEYKKLSAEGQKKMLRIIAKEVKLDMLSPHVFQLYIIWENGIAVHPDVALVWRGVTPNVGKEWSEEEDNIIRLYYLERSQMELMRALPNRSWNRIGDRANVLGIKRPSTNLRGMYHRTVSSRDLEAIMQLVDSEEEKARVSQVVNELAKRTMRGSLSVHWWLPLHTVSYMGLDEASEAKNADLLDVSEFPCEFPHPDESLLR